MQTFLKIFFLISMLLSTQLSAAELKTQKSVSDMIDVESDRLDVDKARGVAVFQGNVKATQNNVLIKGETLTLYLDPVAKKINKMIAEKNVYIKWEDKESTCERAVYTPSNKVLELTGNVTITRGQEKVSGQRVVIDTLSNRQIVEGGKSGRVKLRVNSGSESGVLEWKK